MSNEYRAPILQDEKSCGDGGGGGYTTLQMYVILLNCTLKMANIVNFMLCMCI